jgi:hypothetical protein
VRSAERAVAHGCVSSARLPQARAGMLLFDIVDVLPALPERDGRSFLRMPDPEDQAGPHPGNSQWPMANSKWRMANSQSGQALFVAQGLDGVQVGRSERRIGAEYHAHHGADQQAQKMIR